MKKRITITLLVIATILILIKSGVIDSLLMFLLAGAVPGTNITLSPIVMLIAITSVVALSASKLLNRPSN